MLHDAPRLLFAIKIYVFNCDENRNRTREDLAERICRSTFHYTFSRLFCELRSVYSLVTVCDHMQITLFLAVIVTQCALF